jgi:pSer/pThr/pTyr-binding forkhead associated (FHA) protein
MITCPNCQNKEIEGALFCRVCGAQLVATEGSTTQSIKQLPPSGRLEPVEGLSPDTYLPILGDAIVSLHILDAGQILPLSGREEYTLGRSAEGQSILPDIDLTSYRAYERGVSRMHACIKIVNRQATITDLGSVNGTQINGKKITPNQGYPLKHGDILTLGRLKLQVLLRK